jgi:hypothetical protein
MDAHLGFVSPRHPLPKIDVNTCGVNSNKNQSSQHQKSGYKRTGLNEKKPHRVIVCSSLALSNLPNDLRKQSCKNQAINRAPNRREKKLMTIQRITLTSVNPCVLGSRTIKSEKLGGKWIKNQQGFDEQHTWSFAGRAPSLL